MTIGQRMVIWLCMYLYIYIYKYRDPWFLLSFFIQHVITLSNLASLWLCLSSRACCEIFLRPEILCKVSGWKPDRIESQHENNEPGRFKTFHPKPDSLKATLMPQKEHASPQPAQAPCLWLCVCLCVFVLELVSRCGRCKGAGGMPVFAGRCKCVLVWLRSDGKHGRCTALGFMVERMTGCRSFRSRRQSLPNFCYH